MRRTTGKSFVPHYTEFVQFSVGPHAPRLLWFVQLKSGSFFHYSYTFDSIQQSLDALKAVTEGIILFPAIPTYGGEFFNPSVRPKLSIKEP